MKPPVILPLLFFALLFFILATGMCEEFPEPIPAPEQEVEVREELEIPADLLPWKGWVTWDLSRAPAVYSDESRRFPYWPSGCRIEVDAKSGLFYLLLTVYDPAWVTLPGGGDHWPLNVTANGRPVPVLERAQRPAVFLQPGTYSLQGSFLWEEIPLRLPVAASTGIMQLEIGGEDVRFPAWDDEDHVWLRREGAVEPGERDFLETRLFRLIEDGIPMWLDTEIELRVAGRSREEVLGCVLPEGWSLASVRSPIPVAVDNDGNLRAQVRAGRWNIRLRAFSSEPVDTIRFPEGIDPAVESELIGLKPDPVLRLLEVTGVPAVDATQTDYPERWRAFPVYLWKTGETFQLEERLRGMGLERPEGLRIERQLWLDGRGGGVTFRDRITGSRQETWRLNAAEGTEPGSIEVDGVPQLITLDPANDRPGVEIRTRELQVEASGRVASRGKLAASGWDTDTASLQGILHLPPGWRLFALFGADRTSGDWLTSWTLLDLFLLLVFTIAVFRMRGPAIGAVALATLALTFHEPGAPKLVWLALLIPVALLAVVPGSRPRIFLQLWKALTVLVLLVIAVPFASRQIQQALFPQLEQPFQRALPSEHRVAFASDVVPAQDMAMAPEAMDEKAPAIAQYAQRQLAVSSVPEKKFVLQQDAGARIQTGPGIPSWTWREIYFSWNGPVAAGESIRPILIPPFLERALSWLRVLLVVLLGWLLLRRPPRRESSGDEPPPPTKAPTPNPLAATAALLAVLLFALPGNANADFPPQELLEELRKRIVQQPDLYPAAEIPFARLELDGNQLYLKAEAHASTTTAMPLPGRFPSWSPVNVELNGEPTAVLRRADGFLWIALPAGIHQVEVTGLLPDVAEWSWSFALRPRLVEISAPDWQVSGLGKDGVPGENLVFVRTKREETAAASYDLQELSSVVLVDRVLEIGLDWRVETTVRRLSPVGKALTLTLPLLPGERVLTDDALTEEGRIEVRLGENEQEFRWYSELAVVEELTLEAPAHPNRVERWSLRASPVWNVKTEGLAPVFLPSQQDLVPVWLPWPGEEATFHFERPEAVPGPTVTVDSANLRVDAGHRQRTSNLRLSLRSSLGDEFPITVPEAAEIVALRINGSEIPVRARDGRVLAPLSPGTNEIHLDWRENLPLGIRISTPKVELPVDSANVELLLNLPNDRWVLWTSGPVWGPAVRFWILLAVSLLAAAVLGRFPIFHLKTWQWILLAIGLTQLDLPSAFLVVAWFFALSWRGSEAFTHLGAWPKNGFQILLLLLTAFVLVAFLRIVAEGLLGSPQMFVQGNGSHTTHLIWYQPQAGMELPRPSATSVSIWWYRFAMLAWALWLALSLIAWLRWGWSAFSKNGCFRSMRKAPAKSPTPPPVP